MNRKQALTIWNAAEVLLVLYAWLRMFFDTEEGFLTANGFRNLRFFTTLSNIFVAVVAVVWLVYRFKGKSMERLAVWKFISASAVGLTFMVVLGFLGPLYGFGSMYVKSNYWLHLFVPLMAMIEFVICNEQPVSRKQNLLAILSPLVYGIFYVGNCAINGIPGNDLYGFLHWGPAVGAVIFAAICAVIFVIGMVLRGLNRLLQRRG